MKQIIQQQTVYLNGEYLPMMESQISTQDRGFLFGDGVYEVIPVYNKKLFCFTEHMQRLKNSLQATSIPNPYSDSEWQQILQNLIDRHEWQDQFIYMQITRGVQMQRDHLPAECLAPTIYAYTNPLKAISPAILQQGIKVVTLDDIRWLRCDIKAITLLPNVMMKLAAKSQGADDAILITKKGWVSEGTASNTIIIKNQVLITPPNGTKILPGITRLVIQRLAAEHQLDWQERQVSQQELLDADEVWLTSSTKEALPVCQINGQAVGAGVPGAMWKKMRDIYQKHKQAFIEQVENELTEQLK